MKAIAIGANYHRYDRTSSFYPKNEEIDINCHVITKNKLTYHIYKSVLKMC